MAATGSVMAAVMPVRGAAHRHEMCVTAINNAQSDATFAKASQKESLKKRGDASGARDLRRSCTSQSSHSCTSKGVLPK
ncbi:hypothetical protein NDU88_005991 [Pleurodeles waltl]|uniref:Secreted protein n=1 Tax=Pleurodeles waltl TaxID=8319 RepID=A0AAV7TC64_PLEWA|nr:hypothetical protein NDU88_005991 [Pleurodeles waltl]